MIEYLTYKGRKLPFSITMSTLVEFKKASGVDFETAFADKQEIDKMFELMMLITILAINKGYEQENPSIFKILKNYITTGSKKGIKNSELIKLMDAEFQQIAMLIPKFFLTLSEADKKK